MTNNPLSLPASDLPVREAEHLLSDNKFQGFPIVEDRSNKILVGYIGRTELRYAIEKARRTSPLSPNAKCIFTPDAVLPDVIQSRRSVSSRFHQHHDVPQTFDELEDTTGSSFVDFAPYVDHTPISVHPRLPLETAMELFKKMGPRVILVEQRGRIMGLLTVKDCLKYQFKVEAQENTTAGESNAGLAAHTESSHDRAPSGVEEKIWAFIQRVGRAFWPARDSRITLDRLPQQPGHTREEEYGILDGTEDDNFVELEERGR